MVDTNARLNARIRAWRDSAQAQLPGVPLQGAVGGGIGVSPRGFACLVVGIGAVSIAACVVPVKLFGAPLALGLLAAAGLGMALPQLLPVVGWYRPALIAWTADEVWLLERGAFDRLRAARRYPRPVRDLRWADPGTVVLGGLHVHLDAPKRCRALVERILTTGPTPAGPRHRATGQDVGPGHAPSSCSLFLLATSVRDGLTLAGGGRT